VINNSAQSFLYFGIDPATTSEQRVAETVYEQDYGGKTGSRQIFVSNETHMAGWWSPLVMNRVLTFLQTPQFFINLVCAWCGPFRVF